MNWLVLFALLYSIQNFYKGGDGSGIDTNPHSSQLQVMNIFMEM